MVLWNAGFKLAGSVGLGRIFIQQQSVQSEDFSVFLGFFASFLRHWYPTQSENTEIRMLITVVFSLFNSWQSDAHRARGNG